MSAIFHPYLCGRIAAEWLISMKEKIFSCIQDCVREQSIVLRYDSILSESIDSITFVNIVVALEEEFGFEFEDEMLSVFVLEKVEDLVNYVESCLK